MRMQILSAAPKRGAKEEHILRRQKSGTPPNLIISRSKGLTESGDNKASDTSRSPTPCWGTLVNCSRLWGQLMTVWEAIFSSSL
ncbi:hypothetical protein CDAR_17381 [Caerostris darwini]|uniref:Uncharacterized protein n=1 Tax=Caerostris darwini TaxID=1538125 RepID=A0AAV4VDH7_9ARAC|nr:hypothetical protein CDAR_17381 [Caerostris darwini]